MRPYIFVLIMTIVLSSCGRKKMEQPIVPIDTTATLVMQIQQVSRLYTSEYKVRKIVTHDDKLKWSGSVMKKEFSIDLPLGKRRIAIPMDATIKAYVDFGDFSARNVHRDGEKVEIVLPDPKFTLTSTRIDHNAIRQHVPLMRGKFTDEELTSYEQQGREAIIRDISSRNLVASARQSAARTLIPLFEQMGYREEDITVTFRKDFSVDDIRKLIKINSVENANNAR